MQAIPTTVKIMLASGQGDLLADPNDVDALEQDLKTGGQD